MYLYLKQKVFAIRDKLTFFDEAGTPVFKATGSLFAIPKRLNVTDTVGTELMQVRVKLFRIFLTYGLIDLQSRTEIGYVKAKFSLTKSFKVVIAGETLHIKGSLFGFQFNLVNAAGETLVSVNKKLLSWGDSYQVFIDETKIKPEVAAAICIAFDNAVHSGRNR